MSFPTETPHYSFVSLILPMIILRNPQSIILSLSQLSYHLRKSSLYSHMSSLPRRLPPKHVITVHSRTGHHKLCPRYCRKDSHTRTNRAQGQCPEFVLFLPVLSILLFPFICCSTPQGVVVGRVVRWGRTRRSNELFISYSCLVQSSCLLLLCGT